MGLPHAFNFCASRLLIFACAGATKGISIAGPIPGAEPDSESLRLLRPTLLSLAGYFNTSSVSQEAVQLLVGITPITANAIALKGWSSGVEPKGGGGGGGR